MSEHEHALDDVLAELAYQEQAAGAVHAALMDSLGDLCRGCRGALLRRLDGQEEQPA